MAVVVCLSREGFLEVFCRADKMPYGLQMLGGALAELPARQGKARQGFPT